MRLTSLWIEKLYPTLMSHLHHALNSAYDEDLFITTGILLKCFSHLIAFNLPPFLTSDINIVSDWLITIINLSKVEVPAAIALTPMKDEHECYGVWKTKKWALEFLKRVFLRYEI